MNPKIMKLRGELEKNKGKISDLQGRNRELEKQEFAQPLRPFPREGERLWRIYIPVA